jgi:uncharacterized protein YcfJ
MKLAITLLAILATGCATQSFQPRVDPRQVKDGYYKDLSECQQIASNDHSGNAAVSAGLGAIVGALIGAALGDSRLAAQGAAVGAVSAGSSGLSRSVGDERQMISNCMRGRGHKVLN